MEDKTIKRPSPKDKQQKVRSTAHFNLKDPYRIIILKNINLIKYNLIRFDNDSQIGIKSSKVISLPVSQLLERMLILTKVIIL